VLTGASAGQVLQRLREALQVLARLRVRVEVRLDRRKALRTRLLGGGGERFDG
jgi:hypothetical protein